MKVDWEAVMADFECVEEFWHCVNQGAMVLSAAIVPEELVDEFHLVYGLYMSVQGKILLDYLTDGELAEVTNIERK